MTWLWSRCLAVAFGCLALRGLSCSACCCSLGKKSKLHTACKFDFHLPCYLFINHKLFLPGSPCYMVTLSLPPPWGQWFHGSRIKNHCHHMTTLWEEWQTHTILIPLHHTCHIIIITTITCLLYNNTHWCTTVQRYNITPSVSKCRSFWFF